MTAVAAPRVIAGTTYQDPIAFVVAGGFSEAEARAVINTYKAYFAKHPAGGEWVSHVTANTAVTDGARAMDIMRRYRKFYGK